MAGRPRDDLIVKRRKDFIRYLDAGMSPVGAAEASGHPAVRALQTLGELGFVLTVLNPEERAA